MNDYVSDVPAIQSWFIDCNSQLQRDFSNGLMEKADFWRLFNALQDEYGARLAAAETAYELWWIAQDVPECRRAEQAHIRRRLIARGLVSADGVQQLALL